MNYLIAALVIALAGFAAGWKTQDWRYGAKETERVQAQIDAERVAHIGNIHREETVIAAQNAAQSRAVVARRDAVAARTELERLRQSVASTSAGVPIAACPERAAALGDILGACAERYSELAGKADGHANDVQTLTAAWPRESPPDASPPASPP